MQVNKPFKFCINSIKMAMWQNFHHSSPLLVSIHSIIVLIRAFYIISVHWINLEWSLTIYCSAYYQCQIYMLDDWVFSRRWMNQTYVWTQEEYLKCAVQPNELQGVYWEFKWTHKLQWITKFLSHSKGKHSIGQLLSEQDWLSLQSRAT